MKWSYKFLLTMVVFTLIIIESYRLWGAEKQLILSPYTFDYVATNDKQDGGSSTSSIDINSQSAVLTCELIQGSYEWPYCGLSVHFSSDSTKGWDLSSYHTLEFEIAYAAPKPSEAPTVRIYLRNFNPAYSSISDEYTHKYNGITVTLSGENETLEIPLDNFQVMSWWLTDNHIPIEYSALELTNVNKFEVATGSDAALGKHQITVKSIRLKGRYIEGETLFLSLLAFWMVCTTIIVLIEFRNNKRQADKALAREAYLARLNEKLRNENIKFSQLAHKDPLTGIRNRHAVREWLVSQSQQLKDSNDVFCVLFADIDFFKSVNDQYGHATGDDILREFSLVLSSLIQPQDKLVRWGGEEFVIFCPDTTIKEAVSRAEKMRSSVTKHLWIHGDPITCSIGVADVKNGDISAAIVAADDALYQAKMKGRNRVVCRD
ncbi:hypothetical protein BCU70_06670 [Vibrio sp. 10N.286.49.C2]|uniref:GGDEF domain-containing protein n=1 Tax=unclassified Vibrio TaxID=2614977 RepID=UPI000C85D8DF|nr:MULTISPECIES: GGDEF domain-containing protein [unclassified Vibrio]PMH31571.1 hypothetical protein BCU70_06670 [Vibrio sp. 10N.286.49.C2]PMH50593.1 hypothetical protein BCU66_19030 [Vibrio sp. 10N.286.49.B1]PMH82050.1 hypothetical protein BCU58_02150 [Vibrio sp. 10N.286.48.B7]